RVVHACDGAGHIEVVLRHLAHHEVVLVVTRDRRDDGRAVRTGLGEVLALAAVTREHDGSDLVRDLAGASAVLLEQDQLVTGREELLGQVVADLAAADDDDVHQACPSVPVPWSGWACRPVGAMTRIAPGSCGKPANSASDSTIMLVR